MLATVGNTALSIALWNYAPPAGTGATYTTPPASLGPERTFSVRLQHVPTKSSVELLRVDSAHGNVIAAFDRMGRPPGDLTQAQVAELKAAGAMAPAEHLKLQDGRIDIRVPAQGLAVLLVQRQQP